VPRCSSVLSKILLWALALLLIGRMLVFPRFKILKQKLDRVVNATLVAIVLVYAGRLVMIWME